MRERATLLGGSLDVESANGSFRIRARLPYGDPLR
jgi:signal transduction histidine kinase